jgi:DNA-binding LacI/PurR family transcriptional regulator
MGLKKVSTLVELAKLAGVSPGTVSRALADTGLIAEKTRIRIKKLAAEHGFRPNALARNLRTKKAGAIGVILPLGHEAGQHVSDPFFMTMLGHLADALTERGQDLLLSRVIPRDDNWLGDIVESGRVDGALVIGQSDQGHVLDMVATTYQPMIVWGAKLSDQNYCSVGSDNRRGGFLAAEHLIKTGCRNLLFLGDPGPPEMSQRLEGFRAAISAAGIAAQPDHLSVHLTAETAHESIVDYFDREEMPDGIVAASDIIAMSALRAITERGLRAPDDVSVIGYDDLFIAAHTSPPLTTVRQDLSAGAAILIDKLFRRIAGEETCSVELAPELIVRNTTR